MHVSFAGSDSVGIQTSVGPFDYQVETMSLFMQDCELILARYVANQVKEKVPLYRSQKFWTKSQPKKSEVRSSLKRLSLDKFKICTFVPKPKCRKKATMQEKGSNFPGSKGFCGD